MAFDCEGEFKELYKPLAKPSVVAVSPMSYVAVHGHGDGNVGDGEYKNSIATRLHREIYLSSPRKRPHEKLETVVRHPIKSAE